MTQEEAFIQSQALIERELVAGTPIPGEEEDVQQLAIEIMGTLTGKGRQALIVALGGQRLAVGSLLVTPPTGKRDFVVGWLVPDE